MISLLTTLYEEGKIDSSQTLGFRPSSDHDTRLELFEMIANRRGFGDVLADGVNDALRKMGLEPEEVTTTVKNYQALMEPRLNAMGTMEMEVLVNPRGGVTAMGAIGSPSYNPRRPVEQFLRQSDRVGIPAAARGRIFEGVSFNPARLVRYAEDWFSLHNMLGLCHRLYISRFHSLDGVTAFYNALTGTEKTGADLLRAAERAWNLWRHLNAKLGFTAQDDRPPKSWFRPLQIGDQHFSLTDYYGTKELTEEDVLQLLRDYYDERGWDPVTGNPSEEKLAELAIGL
jgi:aldehyde:ferredoxin oxidoreductase